MWDQGDASAADLARRSAILELVLENVDQGISVIDADLNVVVFNHRFLEILGFPKDRFRPGDAFEKFLRFNAERGDYGPGDIDELVRLRLAVVSKQEPHFFERTRPNGTVIKIRGTPLPGGGFLTTYTDITERRRREMALRESEGRYALATQAVAEGLYDWNIETGEIYYSQRVQAVLGLTPEELSTTRDWLERIHPDDLPRYQAAMRDHLQGKTERFELDYRYRAKNGTWRWARQHGFVSRGTDGRAIRMAGSTGDITHQKELEQALVATKAQLDAAIESVSAGIGLFDADDRLVLCNSHYRQNYPEIADVIQPGVTFASILRAAAERGIVAEAAGRVEEWAAGRLARHLHPSGPFLQRQKDGRWIQIEERRTRDGGIVAVFTDVSTLKGREEALAQALAEKDQLVSQFNAVMETIDAGILFMDPEFHVLMANRAFAEMWGFGPEMLRPGTSFQDLMSDVQRRGVYGFSEGEFEAYSQARLESMRTAETVPVDFERRDGRVFQYQIKPLPNRNRMHTYFDITERKRREQALAQALGEKEELLSEFNAVMDSIDYGILFMDPDLRLRLANRAFREMWGFTEEFLASRPLYLDLMRDVQRRGLYGLSDEAFEEHVERRLALTREANVNPMDLELANGRICEFQILGLPHGRRMWTYFDVTERKRAEEAIRESEQRFKDFASSTSDWFWETGADLRFTYFSERMGAVSRLTVQQTLGKTRQEIAGADLGDPHWQRHLADLAAHRPFKDFRYSLTNEAGDILWFTVSGLPVFDKAGQFRGYRGTSSDVTDQVRRAEELREAKDSAERALAELRQTQTSLVHAEKLALLGQLVAGIAHEIKNPLNFVNNFAMLSIDLLDEIKEGMADWLAGLDPERRADLDDLFATLTANLAKIAEHGKRADGIVKSMLAHSREGPAARQETEINALVEESLNLAYHGARAADQSFNVTLERDLDPGTGLAEIVPQDITRVLLNLFTNGFYATQKRRQGDGDPAYRPTVTAATRRKDGQIEIRVRDNGTGIPKSVVEKIFTPFFTTKPAGEGTGLGLSLSFDIVVHQHGGSLEVDSREGEHTEFVVRLPVEARRAAAS